MRSLATLLFALLVAIGCATQPTVVSVNTITYQPTDAICFGTSGCLDWNKDGALMFTGDVDESALLFMDAFIGFCTQRAYGK